MKKVGWKKRAPLWICTGGQCFSRWKHGNLTFDVGSRDHFWLRKLAIHILNSNIKLPIKSATLSSANALIHPPCLPINNVLVLIMQVAAVTNWHQTRFLQALTASLNGWTCCYRCTLRSYLAGTCTNFRRFFKIMDLAGVNFSRYYSIPSWKGVTFSGVNFSGWISGVNFSGYYAIKRLYFMDRTVYFAN